MGDVKKWLKRGLSFLLGIAMILSGGPGLAVWAEEGGAIVNPNPKIDIVVNVPSDYSGTFLDYKAELEKELIAQGLDPGDFRISNAAVKINTGDLSSWYVYDHYYNQATYNSLGLNSVRQPYAAADNTYINKSAQSKKPITITEYIKEWKAKHNGQNPQYCAALVRHIDSVVDEDEKASMYFMGYGTKPLTDYLFYPAAKDTKRTMSFDIEANKVDTHTLQGAGYLLNAGVDKNGNLQGYVFYYAFSSATAGTAYIYKLKGVNASTTMRQSLLSANCTVVAQKAFALPSDTKKIRVTAELGPTSVTLQQQNYMASGALSDPIDMFRNQTLTATGYNGVGPIVSYKSHGCASLSAFTYSDIVMTYEDNAFEALRETQYADNADFRYFINLKGDSGDPHIPKETSDLYKEGINRLNDREIMYISNANDGRVLTNPTEEHYGIGPDNGCYAEDSENSVKQIAAFIAERFENNEPFQRVELPDTQTTPTGDFKIIGTDGNQIISVHQKHLKTDDDTVEAKFDDASFASPGNTLVRWQYRIYDPDGVTVLLEESRTSTDGTAPESPVFSVTRNSKPGKYTFELTVTDDKGQTSARCTTYFVVYNDETGPAIDISAGENAAVITVTDQGNGIADDGYTILPNQGSGVLKYQVADNAPVILDSPVHETGFVIPLDDTRPITVKAWDECGNETEKVIHPIEIIFDPNGGSGSAPDKIYVPADTAIRRTASVPASDDPDFDFVGWFTEKEGGVQVTAESSFSENTVVYAHYSDSKAVLTFDANGGTDGSITSKRVTVGSLISSGVTSEEGELPTREGYTFGGWTLDKEGKTTLSTTTIGQEGCTVYAKWIVNQYKLIADANGGVLGNFKEKLVNYGTNIKGSALKNAQGQDYSGRDLPTRTGYTFAGWAKNPEGTLLDGTETMPTAEYTVYATWKLDATKNLYHFDKKGGNGLANDMAIAGGALYPELPAVTRPGYDFMGWYLMDGEDGELTDTLIQEGAASMPDNGTEYWLGAKWTARSDTGYTVEHYIKNAEGEYVLAESEKFQGITDEKATAEPIDFGKHIVDMSNQNTVSSGIISGDGKLVLKLYYLNQYDVTGIKYGHGTISGGGRVTEGRNAAVSWSPDEGYEVTSVMVDGSVRDDLLNGGEGNTIGFTDIQADHTVKVEFGRKNGVALGGDENNKYVTIETEQIGGSADAQLSPSKTLAAGSDYTVEWKPGPKDVIKSITVDGKAYSIDNTNVVFRKITGNHKVVVVYETAVIPSEPSVDGFYTITVNSYGGDTVNSSTSVTPSGVVEPGSDHTIKWSAEKGYSVSGIVIDAGTADEIVLTSEQIAKGEYIFRDISANHVVDVTFDSGDLTDPDMTKKLKVTTELVGGPGSITGSATVKEGNDYKVEWTAAVKTSDDAGSPDYMVYEVSEVIVNGKQIDNGNTEIMLKNITENQHVKVVMKPVLYRVETEKVGQGTIDPSKTLYKGQNYTVTAAPADGWILQRVVVDNNVVYDKSNSDNTTAAALHSPSDAVPEGTDSETKRNAVYTDPQSEICAVVDSGAAVPVDVQVSGISKNHKVQVVFVREGGKPAEADSLLNVTGHIEGGPGAFVGSGWYEAGCDTVLSWTVPEGYEVASVAVKVNGAERTDIVPGNGKLSLTDIQDDYDITVYLKKSGGSGVIPTAESWSVSTKITNGEGEITSTKSGLTKGSSWTVDWDYDHDRFVVKEVRIDGVTDDSYLDKNAADFSNITSDHSVELVLAAKGSKEDPGNDKKNWYVISTERTAGGSITPTAAVKKGADHTVEWQPEDGYYVASVIVDGTERGDLLDKNSVSFRNTGRDHHVEVIFAKLGENPPDVDKLHTITTNIASGNGFIDSSVKIPDGENHTINWKPADGWQVKTVIIDGEVRDDLKDTGAVAFTDVTGDHTVTVILEEENSDENKKEGPFRINTGKEGKGTISNSASVNKGDSYTVSFHPAEGYIVSRVEIDGVVQPSLISKEEITFRNIASNHTVNVVFERADGTVIPSDQIVHITTDVIGGLGTITGGFTAEIGENAVVEWKPDNGYCVDMVYVNGEERPDLISQGSVSLKDLKEDWYIQVRFVPKSENDPKNPSGGDPSVVTTSGGGSDKTGVKTGDSANIFVVAALAMLAAAGFCILLGMKKKNKE